LLLLAQSEERWSGARQVTEVRVVAEGAVKVRAVIGGEAGVEAIAEVGAVIEGVAGC
jgi:hypothetical protein